MLVFVSGPLGDESRWSENVGAACEVGDVLAWMGCAVFVPHCYVEWHRQSPANYEEWITRDLAVLRHCNAVVRLPGESPGADREVAEWRRLTGGSTDNTGVRVVAGVPRDPILRFPALLLPEGWTAQDLIDGVWAWGG